MITDHASLKWLANLKDPSGRLGRWALQLQAYDIDLIHRKGKYHQVPDALSRAVEVSLVDVKEDDLYPWYKKLRDQIKASPGKYASWQVVNGRVYTYLASNSPQNSDQFEWKQVIPKHLRR